MKPTKKQLKQLDDFLALADQVEGLVPKAGASDSATSQKVSAIKDAAKKARTIKNRVGIAAAEAKQGREPTVQELIKQYQDLLKQKTGAGLEALENVKDAIDKAIIGKAAAFISAAEAFLQTASLLTSLTPDLQKKVDEVKGWVAKGKEILDNIKKYEDLLLKWAAISKGYIDAGIDGLANASGDIANTVGAAGAKVGGIVADIKAFMDLAKSLPNGATVFSDKIAAAQGMLDKASSVLDKIVGLIGLLPNEENINNIHAWFDKILAAWKALDTDGILNKTDIDNKLAAKLSALVSTAEKWLGEAMKIKNQVLSKIVTIQQMLVSVKKAVEWVQKAGDFLQALKNGKPEDIFKKLEEAWKGIDTVTDIFAGATWDDALLAKIKEIKGKADNFAKLGLSFVEKLTGQNSTQVKAWVQQAMQVVVRMAQGEDVVGQYISIAKQWLQNGLKQISEGTQAATKEVLGQATSFANEIKKFIAGASAIKGANLSDKINATAEWLKSSENIFNKAEEIIGLVVGDKDENGLPDWYDQLDKFWKDKLDGKDFLQGTNFDDKIIATLSGFKKSADEWLQKAVKSSQNLIEKINNVRQWVETAGKALEWGAGIVQKIENKDWAALYDEAMNLWNGIGNIDDVLKGTKLDNKILDKLKEVKTKFSDWVVGTLANAMGGDKVLVNNILGMVDSTIRLLLTRLDIESYSKDFKEDKIIITPPPLVPLTPEEEELTMKRLALGVEIKPGDINSYVAALAAVIKSIGEGLVDIDKKIDEGYNATLAAGYKAAETYKAAKGLYDAAMKIQNETVKLIENILKTATTVLLTVVAPAVGVSTGVIQLIDLGIKTFEAVDKGDFSTAAGLIGDQIGNSMVTTVLQVALPAMLGNKLNQTAEFNLEEAFKVGVKVKYEYVKGFVNQVKEKMTEFTNKLADIPKDPKKEDLFKQIKTELLKIYKQWKGTEKQILDKYVNTSRDKINDKLAFDNFSTGLFSNWMTNRQPRTIRGEDPLIVKEVIKAMRMYTRIMNGVDWDEDSVGGKVSRFFGWLLGDWCTPGHKKAIKKMKDNGKAELARIQTEAAWKGAFPA